MPPKTLAGHLKDAKMHTLTKANPQYITKEKINKMLGRQCNTKVTDEVMKLIERMESDTDLEQATMEDILMSNINVVQELRITMRDYVQAIKFCTLKQNMSNKQAYEIVFPGKVKKHEEDTESRADTDNPMKTTLDTKVSNYNRSAAVVKIDTQMAVAFSTLYATQRHKALHVLLGLMNGKCAPSANGEPMTVTPMVQMQAAGRVLEELKPPEDSKSEIAVTVKAGGLQGGLAEEIAKMTKIQMAALQAGKSITEIQRILPSTDVIEVKADNE